MRKIFSLGAPIIGPRSLLKNFPKIDENVRRIVSWVTFFGLVAGAMSWVADHITPISQYGWGAVVFAGIGVTCAVMLVASGTLVAWRYFNPLPGQSKKLETVLNVISIHVGFDEMEAKGWITMDISAHNSSGITLRIDNKIMGHIELRPMVSLPQWLRSPTFLASTINNIQPWSDFHVTLIQEFPKQAVEATMAAWDQGRTIQLNLSELQIPVSGNGNTNVFLPLWYGATIGKIGGKYLTAELGLLQ
jgi:hypothetical protein